MKRKKVLSILLSIFMLIGLIGSFEVTAKAEKVLKSGDYQYEVLTKNTVAILKYTGSAKNLTIPSSLTDIGYLAFKSCSKLKTINYKGTMAQWKKVNSNKQENNILF